MPRTAHGTSQMCNSAAANGEWSFLGRPSDDCVSRGGSPVINTRALSGPSVGTADGGDTALEQFLHSLERGPRATQWPISSAPVLSPLNLAQRGFTAVPEHNGYRRIYMADFVHA